MTAAHLLQNSYFDMSAPFLRSARELLLVVSTFFKGVHLNNYCRTITFRLVKAEEKCGQPCRWLLLLGHGALPVCFDTYRMYLE